jgi:hypothetical protein
LIQFEPHLQQDFGFQDSLRNLRASARIDTDSPEQNRIMRCQFLQCRIRQSFLGLEIMLAAEGVIGGGEFEPEFTGDD